MVPGADAGMNNLPGSLLEKYSPVLRGAEGERTQAVHNILL